MPEALWGVRPSPPLKGGNSTVVRCHFVLSWSQLRDRWLASLGPADRGRTLVMMMMTFMTQRGESQGKTKKERKATKSKGRGLEEGG